MNEYRVIFVGVILYMFSALTGAGIYAHILNDRDAHLSDCEVDDMGRVSTLREDGTRYSTRLVIYNCDPQEEDPSPLRYRIVTQEPGVKQQ